MRKYNKPQTGFYFWKGAQELEEVDIIWGYYEEKERMISPMIPPISMIKDPSCWEEFKGMNYMNTLLDLTKV